MGFESASQNFILLSILLEDKCNAKDVISSYSIDSDLIEKYINGNQIFTFGEIHFCTNRNDYIPGRIIVIQQSIIDYYNLG